MSDTPLLDTIKTPEDLRKAQHQVMRTDGLILRDNIYGTPEQDALRRDFTINALFYNIDGYHVIDYVGGMDDLDRRLIRSIGDPRKRYVEDPVRMLRAVRFACQLDFRIEDEAYGAICELNGFIAEASNARLYEEVLKLLKSGAMAKTFDLLGETGLRAVLFPELNSWVEAPENAAGAALVRAACRRIDEMTAAGAPPRPGVALALMLGAYHTAMAEDLAAQGMHLHEAVSSATFGHLSGLAKRVMIPKKVGYEIVHILGLQPRFARIQGKHPERLTLHPFFQDAFEYFKFVCGTTGEDGDLVEWWERVARAAPAVRAHHAGPPHMYHPAGDRHGPRGWRGRRRRRGGLHQAGAHHGVGMHGASDAHAGNVSTHGNP